MQIPLAEISRIAQSSGLEFGASLPDSRIVLEGRRSRFETASGLSIRRSDARAAANFETHSRRPATLLVHIVLEGRVEAWVQGQPMDLSRRAGEPLRLGLSALAEPGAFQRRARRGDYLRQLNIGFDWAWLEARGISRAQILNGAALRQDHWVATPAELAMAERLSALDISALPAQLEAEALATALVVAVVARCLPGQSALSAPERERLARMEAFATTPGPLPAIERIAAEGGMSVSSMRRLFHRAHGVAVLERIRTLRLERAAQALQAGARVAEVARAAGYASTAAFSTAFRHWSGQPPSQLRG